jgi:hypothetical protein
MKNVFVLALVLGMSALSAKAHAANVQCKNADYQLSISTAGWDYSNITLTPVAPNGTTYGVSTSCQLGAWPAGTPASPILGSTVTCSATSGWGRDAATRFALTSFQVQTKNVTSEDGVASTELAVTATGTRDGQTVTVETVFSTANPQASCR